MALLINNITTTMVRNELGESTNSVGQLCISPSISMWSPKKPYSIVAPANAETDGLYPRVHGLWRLKNGAVIYKKPSGGASDPYRLGDFRGYRNSDAPPCRAEIISPSTMIEGFTANLRIKLHTGVINPTTLTDKTNPIKREMGEGYGGIAIAARGKSVGNIVSSNDVFSGDGTENTVQIDSNLFDLYYVQRTVEGTYTIVGGTAPYLIEDLSYRDAISVQPFGVEFGDIGFLWVDFGQPMGPIARLSIQLTNTTTSTRTATVVVTATLTNADGTRNISPPQGQITLEGGESGAYTANFTTQFVTQGSNTITGDIKLTYSGVQVGETKTFSRTFTASAPI